MLHALKLLRSQPHLFVSTSSCYRKTNCVRFCREAKPVSTLPDNMDKSDKQQKTARDVMSQSFGEGYAARSDEEGFGGIYGWNQSFERPDEVSGIHENHPDFDKTQGSYVAEKEKARLQTHVEEKDNVHFQTHVEEKEKVRIQTNRA
ncbi:hypothetical protein GIB67_040313 [Kingdonia uniflora]|uniref:Uncharacterized protein n=1 Tax=Kingdonia uniflora TaxID=39325 RepID=A0A7J7MV38_9MAGN|nr:hypothetical protein GIB67_040313 [Kingdonia uniflora]